MLYIVLISTLMLLSALEHVQLSDRKQLDLTSELKSDVKDNVEWERKWLVNLDLTKIKLISLHNSIILIILMSKYVIPSLRQNHLWTYWDCNLLLNSLRRYYWKKLEPWFHLDLIFWNYIFPYNRYSTPYSTVVNLSWCSLLLIRAVWKVTRMVV